MTKREQRYCWYCGQAFVVKPHGGRNWFCSSNHAHRQWRALRRLRKTTDKREGRVA